MLFADVTGSTSLGERLDPERLHDVLDTFFSAMREQIEAEGGTVEKYIGDAVMAVFGVPQAHEDDPARALRAARRMLARLDGVNTDLRARHDVALQIRIGVNTGEVLAAVDPEPGDAMVTGDAVNVAARLQTTASPGSIVAGERVVRSVRGFAFEPMGDLALKGKASPVPGFVLMGEQAEPERGVPGLSAPMVGRERELDLLGSTFDRVLAERRPHLATIYGDPGVGKSRLTKEFVDGLERREPRPVIVAGRCLPYGDGVTYWPLAEILKSHTGIQDTDRADDALRKIRDTSQPMLEAAGALDATRTCAALAYTIGVDDPGATIRHMEPRQVRIEMHAAWRAFFTALALERPLVAIIEDIHWADGVMLDLLQEVAERLEAPVLFLCPARPELTERRPTWGGGRRNASSISLDPLSADESSRLVHELLAIDDLPDATRSLILRRAEGNPFFIEEIVRSLIDQALVIHEDGRWRAAAGVETVEMPDTVQGVLAARIDLLERVEKRTLQRAAVVGRIFWPSPVELLLNGDRDELSDALDSLETRDLVRSRLGSSLAGEPEFIFKHVLTRDVAYESLPRRERSQAHAAVAGWIATLSASRRAGFSELLSYHYEEAYRGALDDPHTGPEETERLRGAAFEALMEASAGAQARFATAKATALAERALAIADLPLERATALELLGAAALGDYRGDRSWEAFSGAVEIRLEHDPGDRAAIARACAAAVESPLRWPGSMKSIVAEEDVRRYIRIGFEHLVDETSETGARLLTAQAFLPFAFDVRRAYGSGEIVESQEAGKRAADIAAHLGRPDLESAALDGTSSTYLIEGRYGDDHEIMERRLAIADETDDPWELGDIYAMGAWSRTMMGDYAEGKRLARRCVEAAAEEAPGVAIHSLSWHALASMLEGSWDEIEPLFSNVRRQLGERAHDPPYFMTHAFGATAFIRAARREPMEDLLDILERSSNSAQGAGPTTGGSVAAAYWYAWIASRSGRTSDAERLIDDLGGGRQEIIRPFSDLVMADCLPRWDAWGRVPAFLEGSRRYAEYGGIPVLRAHLDRLEGMAERHAGELENATRLLRRAIDTFGELGAGWHLAVGRLELAEMLAGQGDPAAAAPVLALATDALEALAPVDELARARKLAERLGGSGAT